MKECPIWLAFLTRSGSEASHDAAELTNLPCMVIQSIDEWWHISLLSNHWQSNQEQQKQASKILLITFSQGLHPPPIAPPKEFYTFLSLRQYVLWPNLELLRSLHDALGIHFLYLSLAKGHHMGTYAYAWSCDRVLHRFVVMYLHATSVSHHLPCKVHQSTCV